MQAGFAIVCAIVPALMIPATIVRYIMRVWLAVVRAMVQAGSPATRLDMQSEPAPQSERDLEPAPRPNMALTRLYDNR